MTMTYTCLTCNLRFEGHPPLDFGEIDIKTPVLPLCPNINPRMSFAEFEAASVETIQDLATLRRQHRIMQGDHVKPVPKAPAGAWASGSAKVFEKKQPVTLTPEQIQQKQQEEARRRELAVEAAAKELVTRLETCISTGKYRLPTSAKYAKDFLYGDDKLKAESDVIDKAVDLWCAKPRTHPNWASSEFKNEQKFRMRNETDFMCYIDDNDTNKGRHNLHVVHCTGSGAVIATPLFETTIQRKMRLGQKIASDWWMAGMAPTTPPGT